MSCYITSFKLNENNNKVFREKYNIILEHKNAFNIIINIFGACVILLCITVLLDRLYFRYDGYYSVSDGEWTHDKTIYDVMYVSIYFIPMMATGILILFSQYLIIRKSQKTIENNRGTLDNHLFKFLGRVTNFSIIEFVLILSLLFSYYNYNLYLGIFSSISVIVIGILMSPTKYELLGIVGLAMGISYLVYILLTPDLDYSIESTIYNLRHGYYFINIYPMISILAIGFCIPQVMNIKIGRFQFGNIIGDFSINIFGSRANIPVISSFIVIIFWYGLNDFWNFISYVPDYTILVINNFKI